MNRGERDNNPGNIRLSQIKFQGEVPGTDPAFKTFSCAHYGIRAIAKILLTYYNNYGLNNVAQLINRWAPDNENDTSAYVDDVARWCGFTTSQTLDLTDAPVLDKLVTAIIRQEEGEVAYSSDEIISAVDDALG